jgi:hypothetical protein
MVQDWNLSLKLSIELFTFVCIEEANIALWIHERILSWDDILISIPSPPLYQE